MVENDDSDRRTVLKLAGLAAATAGGVAGAGTATAADEDATANGDGLVTVAETVERIEAAIEEGDPE